MLDNLIIMDGTLTRASTVGIFPLSESFAYGYGAFTTIKCVNTKFAYFSEHYQRLASAANALDLFLNRSEEELFADLRSLIAVEGALNGIIKVSLIREGLSTHCIVYLKSKESALPVTVPKRIVLSDISRYSKAPQVLHKTHNYLENRLALQQARAMGLDDALMTNERGEITEATSSNVFMLHGDKLSTPRCSCGLLAGVARSRVLALAESLDLRVMEGTYFPQDLLKAKELFLTNAVRGVIPVGEFRTARDKVEYSGRLTRTLAQLYANDESQNLS